jgi:hypothetical protein
LKPAAIAPKKVAEIVVPIEVTAVTMPIEIKPAVFDRRDARLIAGKLDE